MATRKGSTLGALILGAFSLASTFYPQVAYACTLAIGIQNFFIPWTPTVEADCTATGYTVNFLGFIGPSVLIAVGLLIWKYRPKRQTSHA